MPVPVTATYLPPLGRVLTAIGRFLFNSLFHKGFLCQLLAWVFGQKLGFLRSVPGLFFGPFFGILIVVALKPEAA